MSGVTGTSAASFAAKVGSAGAGAGVWANAGLLTDEPTTAAPAANALPFKSSLRLLGFEFMTPLDFDLTQTLSDSIRALREASTKRPFAYSQPFYSFHLAERPAFQRLGAD